MPTYEYLCERCGEQFEVFQSFKDKPLKTHAECGGGVRKVFHASGVVFKGSGFYVTDSRGKKSSHESKPSESKSSESKSSDSKSSDSKSSDSKSASKGSDSKSSGGEKAAASTASDAG